MFIQIDAQSAEPIYEQIAFQVKTAVARGEVAAGYKLPSVRELARELSINPNTVVRAYDTLEREGLIVRRKGAGCFTTGRSSELAEPRRQQQLDELMDRAATEAFHLGFKGEDVRRALDASLHRLRFDSPDERDSGTSSNQENGQ